jgi:hypothetical protein
MAAQYDDSGWPVAEGGAGDPELFMGQLPSEALVQPEEPAAACAPGDARRQRSPSPPAVPTASPAPGNADARRKQPAFELDAAIPWRTVSQQQRRSAFGLWRPFASPEVEREYRRYTMLHHGRTTMAAFFLLSIFYLILTIAFWVWGSPVSAVASLINVIVLKIGAAATYCIARQRPPAVRESPQLALDCVVFCVVLVLNSMVHADRVDRCEVSQRHR